MDILFAFLVSSPMLILGYSWTSSLHTVAIEARKRNDWSYQSYDLLWIYAYIVIAALYSGLAVGIYNTSIEHNTLIAIALIIILVIWSDKPLRKFYEMNGVKSEDIAVTSGSGDLAGILKTAKGWIYLIGVILVSFSSVGAHFLYNVWY